MPGKWTDAHRAAFEATIAARRAGQPQTPPTPRAKRQRPIEQAPGVVYPVGLLTKDDFAREMERIRVELMRETTDVVAAVNTLADKSATTHVADIAERIRQTGVRMEDRLALMAHDNAQAPQTPDAQLLAAMRALNGRMAALEAQVAASAERDTEMLHLLRRLDSRPARVIEFRPDHTRHAEAGRPVRDQRKELGLTKRSRGVAVTRISPLTGKPRKRRSDAKEPEVVLGLDRVALLESVLEDAAGA